MVVLFVIVFVVCMLFYQVVWFWIIFGKNVEYFDNLLIFVYMFIFISSFVNFLVYFMYNFSLRVRLKIFVLCCFMFEGFRSVSVLISDEILVDLRV